MKNHCKPLWRCILSFSILLVLHPVSVFAWGKKGHELVAAVANHYLDDTTRQLVSRYLGGMPFGEAANWMDSERSNQYYNFMRTWHYIDIDKGKQYEPSDEKNIITVLHSAVVQLLKRDSLPLAKKDVKRNLLLMFHLVGDLHQPLHVGYTDDKGGNTIQVTSAHVSGNLHSVWDTDILEYKQIGLDDCLKWSSSFSGAELDGIRRRNILQWMNQSHILLDTIYEFQDGKFTDNYVDNAAVMIEKQIFKAGLRLAGLLTEVFKAEKASFKADGK